VRKPDGKRLLGGATRCWENNIKMKYKKTGWESVDWIRKTGHKDQWRILANTMM